MKGFIKVAQELERMLQEPSNPIASTLQTIAPIAASANAAVENASSLRDLYTNPETAQFDPAIAASSAAASAMTLPAISKMIDDGLINPRTAQIFMTIKDNPSIRSQAMDTGTLLTLIQEMEDRSNTKNFEAQRDAVLQQVQSFADQQQSALDEATTQSEVLADFQKEYAKEQAISKDKTDIDTVIQRVAQKHGQGTRGRLTGAASTISEIQAKPGLNIVHKNLNIAKHKEMQNKFDEQKLEQQLKAERSAKALADAGLMAQDVAAMAGPEKINKAPRLNINKAMETYKNIKDAQQLQSQIKEAAYNVFDMLMQGQKNPVGKFKKTITFILRKNEEDGGTRAYMKKRLDDVFSRQSFDHLATPSTTEEVNVPMVSLIKELAGNIDNI